MKTTDEIRREEEEAEVEDYSGFYDKHRAERAAIETVTVELAHREALAEDNERDTLSNIEETQRMDTEADEREQIAVDDLEAVAAFMEERSNTQEQ